MPFLLSQCEIDLLDLALILICFPIFLEKNGTDGIRTRNFRRDRAVL